MKFQFKANETKKDIIISFPSNFDLRLIDETYSTLEFELVKKDKIWKIKIKHFFARLLLNVVSFLMRQK